MSSRFTGTGGLPGSTSMVFQATKVAHDAHAFGRIAGPPVAPSSEFPIVLPRSDSVDRPFFLWLLAGLVAATLIAGTIALSSAVPILLP